MSWYKPTSLLDKFFEGGIIIKGLSGALELLCAVLLLFINPDRLHHFIQFITQRELLEDPQDPIAHLLISTTQHFNNGSRVFLIIYLTLHAIVKLIAVIGILKNQLWAYPFSMITLGMLMLYQTYTLIFRDFSWGMLLLTIFDIFILWLIWREYGKVRSVIAAPHNQTTPQALADDAKQEYNLNITTKGSIMPRDKGRKEVKKPKQSKPKV